MKIHKKIWIFPPLIPTCSRFYYDWVLAGLRSDGKLGGGYDGIGWGEIESLETFYGTSFVYFSLFKNILKKEHVNFKEQVQILVLNLEYLC